MDRRRFIIATGSAISSASIAGCAGNNPARRPQIQEVSINELTLQATINNADLAESVTFNIVGGGSELKSVSESNPVATYQLGDVETVGTEKQKTRIETEFSIEVQGEIEGEDETENPTDTAEWTYNPEIEFTEILKAEEVGYSPNSHTAATTPVLEISNTGNAPTRVGQIAITRFSQDIPLQTKDRSIGFAQTAIAHQNADTRINRIDPSEHGDHYIPAGESAQFAVDGLLTHTGEPPENVTTHTQTFVVDTRWIGQNRAKQATVKLTGGIQSAEGPADYRFENFEVTDIEDYNPLR